LTGNRERVELNRAESAEDVEDGIATSLEGSRRSQELPGNEKTPCLLSRDPHRQDAIQPLIDLSSGIATVL
jgi:hypothetical protein